MRLDAVIATCLFSLTPLSFAHGQSADSELVRLPGNGTAKTALPGERPVRYVPGGGLLLSFDRDQDGLVTPTERGSGIALAFQSADSNDDGSLSAFEQQAWAANLPTRDESLANPVRFDPNLDRMVSITEFTYVVEAIAAAYVDVASGNIDVENLKAGQDQRQRREAQSSSVLPSPRTNF